MYILWIHQEEKDEFSVLKIKAKKNEKKITFKSKFKTKD